MKPASVKDESVASPVRQIVTVVKAVYSDIRKEPKNIKHAREIITDYMDTAVYIVVALVSVFTGQSALPSMPRKTIAVSGYVGGEKVGFLAGEQAEKFLKDRYGIVKIASRIKDILFLLWKDIGYSDNSAIAILRSSSFGHFRAASRHLERLKHEKQICYTQPIQGCVFHRTKRLSDTPSDLSVVESIFYLAEQ